MITVAVTGGNGFIGSNFVNMTRGRFRIKLIGRNVHHSDAPAARVLLSDEDRLFDALSDCDAIVHCAHTGVNESENSVWAVNLVRAAKRAGIRRIVSFGSFATYNNSGSVISSSTQSCKARIPYVVEKLRLEETYASLLRAEYPSMQLAFLQPAIVTGKGGSWDRFAINLQQARHIYLPNKGSAVCNIVQVEAVVGAISRCLEAPADFYERERIPKLLVAQDAPLTWAEWLERDYGISSTRIQECNANPWAESFKRNLALSLRYSALGDILMRLKRSRMRKERHDQSGAGSLVNVNSIAESRSFYTPEGLDRLTLSCKAVVQKDILP
jgi:nucleoside-diphosphate-sugar epimerase